jgi:hypothetical protein
MEGEPQTAGASIVITAALGRIVVVMFFFGGVAVFWTSKFSPRPISPLRIISNIIANIEESR